MKFGLQNLMWGFKTASRPLKLNQSTSLISNNIGKRCGECETFSRCKSSFCPKTEVEVSRDHPACQMFTSPPILGDWRQRTNEPSDNSSSKNNNFGLHLKAYRNDVKCSGPNPEYCTVYCSKYWSCKLVLDEVRRR